MKAFVQAFILLLHILIATEGYAGSLQLRPQVLMGGGGIIVGNGAGWAEQDTQFALLALPKAMSQCLRDTNPCRLANEERELSKHILEVAKFSAGQSEKLQFVSERKNPGFFTTGSNEPHRVAKTENHPFAPIFFNVDELYDDRGRARLDKVGLTGILIHELGHQAGEMDHNRLDILAGKIRIFLALNSSTRSYQFPHSQVTVDVEFVNFSLPLPIADVYVTVGDQSPQRVSKRIWPHLYCDLATDRLLGFTLSNAHWERPDDLDAKQIQFGAWVQVLCSAEETDAITSVNRLMKMRIDQSGEIQTIQISPMR